MLKRQGHDITMGLKLYGWIGLGQERVRQLFIIFLTVPLILYWINKFLAAYHQKLLNSPQAFEDFQ